MMHAWGLGLISLLLIAIMMTWALNHQPATAEQQRAETAQTNSLHTTESEDDQPVDTAERHYRKGMALLRQAAQSGTRLQLPQAVDWLRQAAEADHTRAQLMLGVMHEEGSGVIQDYEQAVAWYRRAAEQGDIIAMHRVGSMLRRGVGTDKDLIEAYAWCNIAAARGHQEAAIDRNQIGHLLSADEIKTAQQQSRSYYQELPHLVASPLMLPAGL